MAGVVGDANNDGKRGLEDVIFILQELGGMEHLADVDNDGYSASIDCDDIDPSINPSAEEVCNGLDDDCDGDIDEGFDLGDPCVVGSGVCQNNGVKVCTGDGQGTECSAAAGSPDTEVCNGLDDNCDGTIDEGFDLGNPCIVGVGACQNSGVKVCTGDGQGTECSATAGSPGTEVCNGLDDDCDGDIDEDLVGPPCANQDGVCAGSTQTCGGAAGWQPCTAGTYSSNSAEYEIFEVSCDGLDNNCDGRTDAVDQDNDSHISLACGGIDCNDQNPLISPDANEICGDGLDNDCSGTIDDKDVDQDGYIDSACGGDDCNDQNPLMYLGAPEICDNLDNDCNGTADDKDGDQDGYIDIACLGTDCNDASAFANPDAAEVCGDGLDNDCDGSIDNKDADGDSYIDAACGGLDCNDTEYEMYPGAAEVCGDGLDNDCDGTADNKDSDGDTYIDAACGGDDCNDTDALIHPGMDEICGNAVDEDCSGAVDDKDSDGDGFIDNSSSCGGTDCNDSEAAVYPGASEILDMKDNDCDGFIDEGLIPIGSIIITEIMKSPLAVPDTEGEWFEVFNRSAFPINMDSWVIKDFGTDSFTVSAPSGLIVLPGDFAVFCRNGNMALNGGVGCNYVYDNFSLSDNEDEIVLEINDVVIDEVMYNGSFPNSPGKSMNLGANTFDHVANNNGSFWCNATTLFGGGDFGSPQFMNEVCY